MKRVVVFLLGILLTVTAWSQDRTADSFPKPLFGASVELSYALGESFNNGGLAGTSAGADIALGLELGVRWTRWLGTAFLVEFEAPCCFLTQGWRGMAVTVSGVLASKLGPILIQPTVGVGYPGQLSAGVRVGVDGVPVLLQANTRAGLRWDGQSLGVVFRIGV